MTTNQSKARRQLLWMFGIGFAAVGLSYALFYFAKTSGGWGTTNNGTFVDPPVNAGELFEEGFGTEEKWWLWIVTPRCESACDKTLGEMQALHILLNKDADRLSRGLFTDQQVTKEDEHLAVYRRPGELAEGIYIVDPLGNLVLVYPLDTEPKPVLQDLKKLLRLSQIG